MVKISVMCVYFDSYYNYYELITMLLVVVTGVFYVTIFLYDNDKNL